MATKLGNLVTYHEEFPLVKLPDPSITWFCDIHPWLPNIAKCLGRG